MRLRVVLPFDRQFVREAFRVLVGRVDVHLPFRADDPVRRDVGGVEAGDERGDALPVEAQQRAGGLVDLCELRGPLLTEMAITSRGSARNR